jgi:hypothetical protein
MFGEQQYLVVLQNQHELRPTGGFITAYANLDLFLGIPSLEVNDVYTIPDPNPRLPALEPFDYFIGQNDPFFGGHTFRDGNFSPDFYLSAQELKNLYEMSIPESDIDSIIAVDFELISRLLEIYGPITVEDETFTAQSFFEQMQKISKDVDTHNVEALSSRKNIMGPFGKHLMKEIISSPTTWPRLSSTLRELIKSKHLQLAFFEETLQSKAEEISAAGRMSPPSPTEDFLHVNIANIGGRKADRYLTKHYFYRADFSNPEEKKAVLTIDIEHLGSYNIQSDIYQSYVRSYVPLGSQLQSGSTGVLKSTESFQEEGFQVFADSIRLRPGQRLQLSYEYLLPESITEERYRLQLVTQAGVQNDSWNIAIKQQNDSTMVNIPEASTLNMSIRENLALWQGTINQDQLLEVRKAEDNSTPIILWQKFVDYNTINIRFNELLEEASAENIQNYRVADLNSENPVQDSIVIQGARFSERDVWLDIEGLSYQPEESYEVQLRDIRDLQGNYIQPNPLTRTLIQRLEAPSL